ncbi:MAG: 30S ribosomal protein S4e [Candidatus Aenigmarchaeota archaeon]|nr:30S ribosomal protein S4e [Candidatus Aenigmarchaeota archaeon]
MSRHMKKYAAPRSWNILRKDQMFIKKPTAGPASLELSQTLDLTLKQLKLARTARETKRILTGLDVLVDGRKVRESAFPLGVMAVLSFPKTNMHYRMMLDAKGRLVAQKIDVQQAVLKITKIINKTKVSGGKIQLNMSDGRNILVEKGAYKVGDSLVIGVPDQVVKEHLPLAANSNILLLSGKQAGVSGILTEIIGKKISYTHDGKQSETCRDYALVTGPSKTLQL